MKRTNVTAAVNDSTGNSRAVKVLLALQAILISIIIGLLAGILSVASGMLIAAAVAAGGGAFLIAVPVVLGAQRAITE